MTAAPKLSASKLARTVFLFTFLTSSIHGLIVTYDRRARSTRHHNRVEERWVTFNEQLLPAETVSQTGQSVVLHCSAAGKPAPTIHWLFRGTRLPQGLSETVFDDEAAYETTADAQGTKPALRLGRTKSRLYLDCVTSADAGEYTCVAETPYERITNSTTLTVENSLAPDYVESCVMRRVNPASPARIHMWTVQRVEFEGISVQMFCRASGIPTPKVNWFDINNERITAADENYTILENGDLVIRSISWGHMGLYRCEARNTHGVDEVSTFLYPTFP